MFGLLALLRPRDGTENKFGLTPGESQAFLRAWIALQLLGGQIGLPLLLLTITLAKNVKRHPTLINLFITLIMSATYHCLLFYAGKQNGDEPPLGICLAQSALIYGVRTMMAMSTLCIVFHVWSVLRIAVGHAIQNTWTNIRDILVLMLPWLTFVIFTVATAVLGGQDKEHVTRARTVYYCTIDNPAMANSVSIFCGVAVFIALCFEGHVVFTVYHKRKAVRRLRSSQLDMRFVTRVGVFTFWAVFAFAVCLDAIFAKQSIASLIFLATIPLVAFLVFAIQTDVLNVWLFWRPPRPLTTSRSHPSNSRSRSRSSIQLSSRPPAFVMVSKHVEVDAEIDILDGKREGSLAPSRDEREDREKVAGL